MGTREGQASETQGSGETAADLLDRIEAIADREITKLKMLSDSDIVLDAQDVDKLHSLLKAIVGVREENRRLAKMMKEYGDDELARLAK